jgi:hypothetical protein
VPATQTVQPAATTVGPGNRRDMLHSSLQDATLGATADVPPSEIHILLVDDERLSRVVVSNLLKKCNYRGANFPVLTLSSSFRCLWAFVGVY